MLSLNATIDYSREGQFDLMERLHPTAFAYALSRRPRNTDRADDSIMGRPTDAQMGAGNCSPRDMLLVDISQFWNPSFYNKEHLRVAHSKTTTDTTTFGGPHSHLVC